MKNKLQSIILGIMCFVLTILICIQVKTVSKNGTTVSVNQQESELKSQVLKMKEKYENQYAELEKLEKELEATRKNITSNNEELKKLEEKINEDNKILGMTDVKGKGVTVVLQDGVENSITTSISELSELLIHDSDVLRVVNELKNAGAEAISINGKRIVNTTAISCDGNVIVVNGEKIGTPIEISAIGLPEQLSMLNRPGGVIEYLLRFDKKANLIKNQKVEIPKYTGVFNFKYAKTVK